MDQVPRALIVFAVLFRHNTVSLLDMQVRFDYPERASAGKLLQNKLLRTAVRWVVARFCSSGFESGFIWIQFRSGIQPQAALFGQPYVWYRCNYCWICNQRGYLVETSGCSACSNYVCTLRDEMERGVK